ncbi:FkbM family methyltransferase [Ruegeria sediminis]|uniref:FkbM family methyltransferase n=1 Tax=Ruegeria sediminis TaxID=2583820 RepID=A0ABY2WX40_9RHOB|nr:FkbM family methyltransferase [Ruegeria sediminis]TMV07027.1 FkbM family methyltransferase [Ruegeria sediminis]
MKQKLAKLVESYPALQKPAYFAYVGANTAKNVGLRFAMNNLGYLPRQVSDRGQDIWVINEVFNGKRNGFFVELGAADGFSESNTFILEKHYGWSGLLIEPNPINYHRIKAWHNRSATAVPLAVDPVPGNLEFMIDGQRSSLLVEEADNMTERRAAKLARFRSMGRVVTVEAVPLEEVFDRYGAPEAIDYFSLDVEGSETRILRNFPFDRYRFLAMTIERPTPELNALLFANGYHFVRNSLYDTFYVHESNPRFDEIEKLPFEQLPPKTF